jgi:hypothetical protein
MTKCRDCGCELTDENWLTAYQLRNRAQCKACKNLYEKQWRVDNPDKAHKRDARLRRNKGIPKLENSLTCPSFLGVHLAENMVSEVFNEAKMMPYGHKGFDMICPKGKTVDVKSACAGEYRGTRRWIFHIKENKVPDYFMCVAYDSRDEQNVEHVWFIPGNTINHLKGLCISESTMERMDSYKLRKELKRV